MDDLDIITGDEPEFFAPVASDLIDGLLGQYQMQRRRCEELAAKMDDPDTQATIHWFLDGNYTDDRGRHSLAMSAAQLFCLPGAIAALNSAYWSKALAMTDVIDMMPQKRRSEWHETISGHKAPDFEEETVRRTLNDLLNMRAQFLAERVDGIFRGLSGEHVTNAPEAFGKRMILSRVLSEWGTTNHDKVGLINDLRCVIAKFMGRDEPPYHASDKVVLLAKANYGEWLSIDGGALKLRVYKKGTGHLEVHPDMAWRLNQILAHLYPLAIPAQFRHRPPRKAKQIDRIQRPLPFAVIDVLQRMGPHRDRREPCAATRWEVTYKERPNTLEFGYGERDKHASAEAERIIEAIGGVRAYHPTNQSWWWWEFDYDPRAVRDMIVASGCIPDQKSHQFYPTPRRLAEKAVELAEIEDAHTVLEPSAGIGGIADLLPKERTTCVEVSALHSKVLAEKGHNVITADFLAWAAQPFMAATVDRIVMNPPFDRGQWAAHVEHAAPLLKPGGRLVAILPSGARGRDFLPRCDKAWHGPYSGEFAGTSIEVVIMVATLSD